MMRSDFRICVLYQSTPPPKINGISKPMKPGGYAEGGADIAYALFLNEFVVITPHGARNVIDEKGWVFPDSEIGISDALNKGANVFWLNTVLFKTHPVTNILKSGYRFVGQDPLTAEDLDDKWIVHNILKRNSFPVPYSFLIDRRMAAPSHLDNLLSKITFPLILKPIRGRGSSGVVLIKDSVLFRENALNILSTHPFDGVALAEEYLPGREVTITVLPSGTYTLNGISKIFDAPWCLPPIVRYDHVSGVMPYSGDVQIIENSRLLTNVELCDVDIRDLKEICVEVAKLLSIRAAIRIDCRQDSNGRYCLFDLNMKPNMSGAIRDNRDGKESLSALAAKGIGWDYRELIMNLALQAWSI